MQVNNISASYLSSHGKLKNSNNKNSYQTNNQSMNYKSYNLANIQANYMSNNISFGRTLLEHELNGAFVDKTKNVFFKLLTFPDVKQVSVVIAKEVKSAKEAGKNTYEITKHLMQRDTNDAAGIFQLKVPPHAAQDGDKYAFEIIKSNDERFLAPDIYAKRKTVYYNPDSYLDDAKLYRTDRFSEIYDNNTYKWHDEKWRDGLDKRRVSVISDAKNGLKTFKESRIYELCIPTFSKKGTLEAAKAQINEMFKQGFFKQDGTGTYNTLEFMPLDTANSVGLSYDGTFKNAVMEALGGPDKLKELIDFVHSKGINAVLDTVPNHFGTDYNLWRESGPYLGPDGPFGPRANLENDFRDNKYVRDYITNACALDWLRDFHFDGIRLDFTHEVGSETALRQLVNEVRYHEPHAFVVLEDGRVNETSRLTGKLSEEEIALNQPESAHAEIIKRYDANQVPDNIGANARWSYEYEHALKAVTKGDISVSEFRRAMIDAHKRQDVLYAASQNHDEKTDGLTQIVTFVKDKLNLVFSTVGKTFTEQCQKAARKAQLLVNALVSGKHTDLRENHSLASDFLEVDDALNYAVKQNKVSLGLTATIPNPKLRAQGTIEPFYFFRKFAIEPQKDWDMLKAQKGYLPDENAMNESKLGSIKIIPKYKKLFNQADKFEQDVNEFAAKNPAMSKGYIYEDTTVAHDGSRVLGTHIKKDDSEVFTVANFSGFSYNDNYRIQFPKGQWREVINSNNAKYGGDGLFNNPNPVIAAQTSEQTIALPANSLLVFEKVG